MGDEFANDGYSHQGQEQTRSWLRRIERREWWLWATAVIVTLLLTAGILSFLPVLLIANERSEYMFIAAGDVGTARNRSVVQSVHCISATSASPNAQTLVRAGRTVPSDQ
jgi:hypothetical protein